MQTETILGQVIGKANNYQAVPDGRGGRRIIKNGKVRDYERRFCEQCKIYRNKAIDTPFTLSIDIYQRSARYDLDNSLKTVLDCLQTVGAITDDSLCYRIDARKHICRSNPRITFAIHTTQPSLFDD